MLFFPSKRDVSYIERKIGAVGAIRHKDGRDMRSDCKVSNITKNQQAYKKRRGI